MDENAQGTLIVTIGKCLPDAADKYVYPVVPGMAEWTSVSPDEKDRLSRLPEKKLKELSTFALIQSLLEMPLLSLNYWASSNSSPLGTCDVIFSMHNSIPEFENRKNSMEALIAYFEATCLDCLPSLDVHAATQLSIQLTVLEMLFTRKKILQPLDAVQKKRVVALMLDQYKQKAENRLGVGGTLAAMAWIMYDDHYLPIRTLYENRGQSRAYFEVYQEEADYIVSSAENYIH
ncbi:MAG: hypothetical protein LBG28_04570 [Tannerella sp.]|jgi:hypothetical protein|nr:hypothetical protein [Tannerella sp.]